ncbi:hypothetical protein AMS68_005802 [Peltaster fructicola]|uniref:J domain-containing protein n=1 Tax=Peltaster fructicola TaxID=286661 RepID=A0A6H0Y046_9PEZI|nr:hypothetical protein AMS68_005802 [Peltaster fructicola]
MIVRTSLLALGALCLSSSHLVNALAAADIPTDIPVNQLISSANSNLARGNTQDALVYFDVAIQRDPSNYLTIFKRGATYLSLGRNAQASKDFDQVLVLKPSFEGALTQRAKLKQRIADWTGARKDYIAAGKQDSAEIQELDEAERAAKLFADAESKSAALELRQRRARCRFEKGEVVEGISDLQHVLQLNNQATEPSLRIAAMTYFSLGEIDKGITAVSKCLQRDPDDKPCVKLRKSLKALDRSLKKVTQLLEKRQFASAVKLLIPQAEEPGLLREVKDETKAYRDSGYIHPNAGEGLYTKLIERTCEAYVEMNNKAKAQPYCDEALTYDANCLPALLLKAQRQIDADEFEAALSTLQQAEEAHGGQHKIRELHQKAQTLLKRSKQKDYYKVLGVSRDADDREIKKAFRKLSVQNHPDRAAKNGITPEEAQKKMSAINEAHEVLSDPELRARFDQGDDPNDPSAGQQPFQGSPFGNGQQFFFQQGGGGGGQFKFQHQGFQGFPGGFPFG